MARSWVGTNIGSHFEAVFKAPIFADNESNCAAIAEMMWGAAAGCDDFIFFKIDVGVGGAIVVNRKVLMGKGGGAGEFGHMPIDPDGESLRMRQSRMPRTYREYVLRETSRPKPFWAGGFDRTNHSTRPPRGHRLPTIDRRRGGSGRSRPRFRWNRAQPRFDRYWRTGRERGAPVPNAAARCVRQVRSERAMARRDPHSHRIRDVS